MYPKIKILMTGGNEAYLSAEQTRLKEMGFSVYTALNACNLPELVEEIHPDLIFLDHQNPSEADVADYNNLLDDLHFTGIPIMFTLSPDDVYLVTRKRTLMKDQRSLVAHSLKDALKQALHPGKMHNNVLPVTSRKINRNYTTH